MNDERVNDYSTVRQQVNLAKFCFSRVWASMIGFAAKNAHGTPSAHDLRAIGERIPWA